MPDTRNQVLLCGKVSRVGGLKYTPAGVAICEFTLAFPQIYFGKESVGYIEAMISGKYAEEQSQDLKVGKKLALQGSLWSRTFRNRQGVKVQETKLLVDSIKGDTK